MAGRVQVVADQEPRAWRGSDRDIAAQIIGVDLTRTKVLAFVISLFYAGVAGALPYSVLGVMGRPFSYEPTHGSATTTKSSHWNTQPRPPRRTAGQPEEGTQPMRSTTSQRGRRLLACAAALALVVTGCSNTDSEDTEQPTVTGTTAATADATTPTDASTDDDGETGGDVATGVGVTAEPCPDAVNQDNGCIFLGILSDLTEGPFAPLAVPTTAAQEAFWNRVNEDGGIGGEFDVNVIEYTRDNKYNPEIHNQVYQEIKPDVVALAQTLGSPTTTAIIEDMIASDIVAAPASWTSLWDTAEAEGTNIVESGSNYCVESMNAIDYHAENAGKVSSVLAVHLPGGYGEDGAAGASIGADAHGADFDHVEIPLGGEGAALQGAVDAIVQDEPDVVVITATPGQLAEIVGGAVAQGWQGAVYGNGPTWNGVLLDTAAAPALQGMYKLVGPWQDFDSDTPAHNAMREALGEVEGNEGYTSGWGWSYPLLAALEQAHASGDLTRAGLLDAVTNLETVDYEGMLPEEAGTFTGDMNEQVFRGSSIGSPDPEAVSGISSDPEFYFGDTAANHDFTGACYQVVDLDG